MEIRGEQSMIHLQRMWSILWPRTEDMPILFDLLALYLRHGYELGEITLSIEELGWAGLWPDQMAEWPLESVLRGARAGGRIADLAEQAAAAYVTRGGDL